jgi:hypothetical protein
MIGLKFVLIGFRMEEIMKNRFIEYILEKQRQEESVAMNDSYKLYDEPDPTKYNPFNDEQKEEQ